MIGFNPLTCAYLVPGNDAPAKAAKPATVPPPTAMAETSSAPAVPEAPLSMESGAQIHRSARSTTTPSSGLASASYQKSVTTSATSKGAAAMSREHAARQWWLQKIAREKYARAAMTEMANSED